MPSVHTQSVAGAAAAMQVASRIWVLWGIVWLVPGETTGGALPALGPLSPTFTSLVTAWALSEIFRYGFFSAKVEPRVCSCLERIG